MTKLAASFALVVEAINEVVRKRKTLLAAAFLPIVGIVMVSTLSADLALSGIFAIMLLVVTLPLYVLFATVIHRVVLLGEHSLPSRWGIFWTERETRFLGWLIGVMFLYFAVSLPATLIILLFSGVFTGWDVAWIATFLSYLVVAYFEGRFTLVLPATATDKQSSFRDSWAMTRGKGMMIAVALVIPTMILMPVEWVLYETTDEAVEPIIDLVWMLLFLPVFAVQVAIISLAYGKLSSQD